MRTHRVLSALACVVAGTVCWLSGCSSRESGDCQRVEYWRAITSASPGREAWDRLTGTLEEHPEWAGMRRSEAAEALRLIRESGSAEERGRFAGCGLECPANGSADPNPYAVHRAVKEGNADAVALLLQHGADVNVRDATGSTPLHYAAAKKDARTERLLLEHGAEVNCANGEGDTPLHEIMRHGWSRDAAVALLEHGADPMLKGAYGQSLFDLVSSWEVARFIAERTRLPAGGAASRSLRVVVTGCSYDTDSVKMQVYHQVRAGCKQSGHGRDHRQAGPANSSFGDTLHPQGLSA